MAVTVTTSNPTSITNQPFSVTISVSGAVANTTNYLEVDLFQTGTTSYFGYTNNGSSFIKNGSSSNCTQYYSIPIDSTGSWSGTIEGQLDSSSSNYTGPGSYSLKVRRYTASCSYIWSNEVILTINAPSPTPSSTSSSSPATSPSNTFTISNIPQSINSNASFNASINLSLPSNPNANFYIKGAFQKSGSSNYFGKTSVGGSFIKNSSSYSNQASINTDSNGSYSGSLTVMPDDSDSGFLGDGDYSFKVGRYSSDGSGPSWSNEATIHINEVAASTQTPSPTPSATTSKSPSPSSTSTITSEKSPSIDYSKELLKIGSIAGVASSASEQIQNSTEVKAQSKSKLWIILVIPTVGLLVFYRTKLYNLFHAIQNR